ncbi:hypothetical protein NWP96_05310 [Mycoplasmopsis cynos]|uniref:hypothetical protein n=1 Tax=Mycoplasmopsis cynos TaxID=171284 RepID=UPI0024CD8511|nr:hypothetical protein [Mycoplasmopsis cynos]MCU9936497.1 hypothetical protein [Mycoplasmopsis cynos]WAM03929.1 hypothetical protein ONA22_02915 [Mycoplasmopsis cynos]
MSPATFFRSFIASLILKSVDWSLTLPSFFIKTSLIFAYSSGHLFLYFAINGITTSFLYFSYVKIKTLFAFGDNCE